MQPYNKYLKLPSRALRNNMTDAEHWLWQRLRRKQILGLQFYRQKPILNFIVDFYCPLRTSSLSVWSQSIPYSWRKWLVCGSIWGVGA